MDPASARLVRESILRLRSSSRALIVCSHNLNEAEALSDRIAIIRKGKIVAMGSSEDLKRRFLGNPVMKIVLSESLNGLRPALPAGVSSIEYGANWIQYAVAKPKEVNPQVLHDLAEAGYRVVTLSEVGRSLEDVYMNAVQGHIED
jgi:ABC-2 type transport system ATP-binding protein